MTALSGERTVPLEELLGRLILGSETPEFADKVMEAAKRLQAEWLALYECELMDSSHFGERFVICVGAGCLMKTPADLPAFMSRRGLASDTSSLVMVAALPPEEAMLCL